MGLSYELQEYAENLWRRFPEEFILLGSPQLEDVFELNVRGRGKRCLADARSKLVVQIVLPKKPRAGPGTAEMPSPCGAKSPPAAEINTKSQYAGHRFVPEHAAIKKVASQGAQEGWVNGERKPPRLSDVFGPAVNKRGTRQEGMDLSDGRHQEIYREWATARQRVSSQSERSSLVSLEEGLTETALHKHLGHTGNSIQRKPISLTHVAIQDPFLCQTPSPVASACSATSSTAIRRGFECLSPLVTRPPPSPSSDVVRAPHLDRRWSNMSQHSQTRDAAIDAW
mmetsp:Transcript_28000/g.63374  ORF Transcript_28000/g.63374 Transcript_28000/m.63374 type:complete len:283 (-) Transcript_28000:95-943(-)